MSGARALERELIVLAGAVDCHTGSGAVTLALAGRERGGATGEVLFAGASVAAWPRRLHDVRVVECTDEDAGRRYRIEASGAETRTLAARGVQVHRAVADRFFRRLPPARVPWTQRLGWGALLALLRVPSVAAWLTRGGPS